MSSVPIIPDSAPFNNAQRAWLNGFLAGLLSRGSTDQAASGALPANQTKLLIAFGSQSGNAESLAKRLAKEAHAKGFLARALGLETLQAESLNDEQNLMLITSTWGDGEMPDNAAEFWNSLNQNGSSPNLAKLRFSVLALGDSNYGDTFCKAGKDLDQRLEELGAQRLHPRVDCDVEFDELAKTWSQDVFAAISASEPALATSSLATSPVMAEHVNEETSGYTKKNPWLAPLLKNLKLNEEGSSKDTRHIVFSLEGSGVIYETGDALGVFVQNCPEVVDRIIADQQFDPGTIVSLPNGEMAPLREALIRHYEVRSWYQKKVDKSLGISEFMESLRKLQPRLYSIASSQKAHPNEVHLCVGAVRYESDGIKHKGVASTYLADRCNLGEVTGVFVHSAKHFRVPSDTSKPIIMVGPGTGIAPFRAFLEERKSTGATGQNWLFFGDQFEASDYLYRHEVEAWQQEGLLTRLSLAFSRDQQEKIYVQTRMMEAAEELWNWLENGAHFYVCGDASRMAKDVDAALHKIIESAGRKDPEAAVEYVQQMKKSKRYCRDVY